MLLLPIRCQIAHYLAVLVRLGFGIISARLWTRKGPKGKIRGLVRLYPYNIFGNILLIGKFHLSTGT